MICLFIGWGFGEEENLYRILPDNEINNADSDNDDGIIRLWLFWELW